MKESDSDNAPITFRPLTEEDLPMLCNWLNRPHLQRWWREDQISVDAVRARYLPRIAGEDDALPFIATLDDEPIGYIQCYRADRGVTDWWPDDPKPGTVGIDQFICDGDRLGQGLGTRMVGAFVELLFSGQLLATPGFGKERSSGGDSVAGSAFDELEVAEIRVDPVPENMRAIRCYEKVGFRTVGPMTNPDGPAVLMVLSGKSTLGNNG